MACRATKRRVPARHLVHVPGARRCGLNLGRPFKSVRPPPSRYASVEASVRSARASGAGHSVARPEAASDPFSPRTKSSTDAWSRTAGQQFLAGHRSTSVRLLRYWSRTPTGVWLPAQGTH